MLATRLEQMAHDQRVVRARRTALAIVPTPVSDSAGG
jgi:hypothetical protein